METVTAWKARLKILPITETKSQSHLLITGNCSKIIQNAENNSSKLIISVLIYTELTYYLAWYLLDNENNKALQQGKNLLKKLPNKGKFDINFQILQDDQCKFV